MPDLETKSREVTVTTEPTPGDLAPVDRKSDETPLEAFASICGILVIGLFALTFIFQNFMIPSSSMENTLLIGDHVLVDRVTLAPPAHWAPFVHYRDVRRRDIIVFFKPGYPDLYLVKRVIGIPGDRIHLRNGTVYLNGQAQDEPYAAKTDYSNYSPYRDDFPAVPSSEGNEVEPTWSAELPTRIQGDDLVVPAGHYFCMGDNRPNSLDSRYWGFVPRENIVGRPLFVYWSFITSEAQEYKTSGGERVSFMTHMVVHFFDQTRWNRTFHLIR
jgi:signal peptidase I